MHSPPPSPSPAPEDVPVEPRPAATLSAAEIDASCRWPVLFLLVKGVSWLLLAGALTLVTSVKIHAPGVLADCAWLTYGRLQPAAWNALVLGFLVPAGLAVAVWLTARLGGTRLVGGGTLFAGGVLWNLGLGLGILGLLAGHSTGIESLELPRYASPILGVAYLLMAVPAVLTLRARRRLELYPAQWFLFAAWFAFPWLFAVGHAGAVFFPMRGVLQAAVQAWYLHGLLQLVVKFGALALVFYLLPKLLEVPLASRSLAAFTFWTWLVFGTLGGVARYVGGPFPAWMISAGVAANALLLVPWLAMALNLAATVRGQGAKLKSDPVLWFVALAGLALLLSGAWDVVTGMRTFSRTYQYTSLGVARDLLALLGCGSVAILAAVYHLVPRLAGTAWPAPAWVRVHFGLLAAGLIVTVGGLGLAGLAQGAALADATAAFPVTIRRALPYQSLATLGLLLILAGNLLLALNLARLFVAGCAACCGPACRAWFALAAEKPEGRA